MSLGLSMITNKAEATIKFLEAYGQYFDKWFITVADKDKKQRQKLVTWDNTLPIGNHKLQPSYYKWTDDFAAARNANLRTVDTDYWFWADDDDTIQNPERLADLVRFMQSNDLDVVQLKYDYAQNDAGQAISDHWRERLIRTDYDGHWDAPVHETFQGPPAKVERSEWIVVKHQKDRAAMKASMARNERILRKHWAETKDPRDASYLGMTELAARNYEQAIAWFEQHIALAGSEEDRYRSWCRIADAEWLLGNNEQSLYATDEAIKLRPGFPDAYYIKIMNYVKLEQYDHAIEWLKVAMNKPVPDTLHMIDPTLYQYRGMAMGAMAFLFSGRVKEAFKLYNAVIEQDPDFYKKEKAIDGVDWERIYEDAYFDSKAIDYTKWLLHYTKGVGGKPLKLFEALPQRILADSRLNAERVKFMPAKKWPPKSIVFYTGASTEIWGPDTLDKGMGGSEEAVVYLSRELAKLGWEVTVYQERDEQFIDGNYEKDGTPHGFTVTYLPWQLFNPNDTFDVFVAWRNPSFARAVGVKARIKAVDLHDTPIGHQTITSADAKLVDKFMFKTAYQAGYAPKLPKEKVVIIPNGLAKEHFSEA